MAAKTYDYIITIKPSKNNAAFDWITQFLLFIAAALLIYSLIKTDYPDKQKIAGIICVVGIAGIWIYSKLSGSNYRIALSLAAIGIWTLTYNLWLGIAYAVLAFVEKQVKFKQEIGIDDDGVTFNSFPKKTYQWHEVSNVVLKDGIITVDLHNNKIFQKELESDTTPEMEKEFNEFCRAHMFSFAAKA